MLTVPQPTLSFEDAGGGVAALEKPVTVQVGPVLDGTTALGPAGLGSYGYFMYRTAASGSSIQLWDGGAKNWVADPGPALSAYTPAQFAFKQGSL